MTSPRYGDDVVDTRRQRVRKFLLEVYRLATDTAVFLRSVYFFLVRLELPSLCTIMVGPQIRFCCYVITSGKA